MKRISYLSKSELLDIEPLTIRATSQGIDMIDVLPVELTEALNLYVSKNNIYTLENIAQFKNLEKLMIEENKIYYIEDLMPLKDLTKLHELKIDGNPVCSTPLYELHILALCPSLKFLNGIPVSEFYPEDTDYYFISNLTKQETSLLSLLSFLKVAYYIANTHKKASRYTFNSYFKETFPTSFALNKFYSRIRIERANDDLTEYIYSLKSVCLDILKELLEQMRDKRYDQGLVRKLTDGINSLKPDRLVRSISGLKELITSILIWSGAHSPNNKSKIGISHLESMRLTTPERTWLSTATYMSANRKSVFSEIRPRKKQLLNSPSYRGSEVERKLFAEGGNKFSNTNTERRGSISNILDLVKHNVQLERSKKHLVTPKKSPSSPGTVSEKLENDVEEEKEEEDEEEENNNEDEDEWDEDKDDDGSFSLDDGDYSESSSKQSGSPGSISTSETSPKHGKEKSTPASKNNFVDSELFNSPSSEAYTSNRVSDTNNLTEINSESNSLQTPLRRKYIKGKRQLESFESSDLPFDNQNTEDEVKDTEIQKKNSNAEVKADSTLAEGKNIDDTDSIGFHPSEQGQTSVKSPAENSLSEENSLQNNKENFPQALREIERNLEAVNEHGEKNSKIVKILKEKVNNSTPQNKKRRKVCINTGDVDGDNMTDSEISGLAKSNEVIYNPLIKNNICESSFHEEDVLVRRKKPSNPDCENNTCRTTDHEVEAPSIDTNSSSQCSERFIDSVIIDIVDNKSEHTQILENLKNEILLDNTSDDREMSTKGGKNASNDTTDNKELGNSNNANDSKVTCVSRINSNIAMHNGVGKVFKQAPNGNCTHGHPEANRYVENESIPESQKNNSSVNYNTETDYSIIRHQSDQNASECECLYSVSNSSNSNNVFDADSPESKLSLTLPPFSPSGSDFMEMIMKYPPSSNEAKEGLLSLSDILRPQKRDVSESSSTMKEYDDKKKLPKQRDTHFTHPSNCEKSSSKTKSATEYSGLKNSSASMKNEPEISDDPKRGSNEGNNNLEENKGMSTPKQSRKVNRKKDSNASNNDDGSPTQLLDNMIKHQTNTVDLLLRPSKIPQLSTKKRKLRSKIANKEKDSIKQNKTLNKTKTDDGVILRKDSVINKNNVTKKVLSKKNEDRIKCLSPINHEISHLADSDDLYDSDEETNSFVESKVEKKYYESDPAKTKGNRCNIDLSLGNKNNRKVPTKQGMAPTSSYQKSIKQRSNSTSFENRDQSIKNTNENSSFIINNMDEKGYKSERENRARSRSMDRDDETEFQSRKLYKTRERDSKSVRRISKSYKNSDNNPSDCVKKSSERIHTYRIADDSYDYYYSYDENKVHHKHRRGGRKYAYMRRNHSRGRRSIDYHDYSEYSLRKSRRIRRNKSSDTKISGKLSEKQLKRSSSVFSSTKRPSKNHHDYSYDSFDDRKYHQGEHDRNRETVNYSDDSIYKTSDYYYSGEYDSYRSTPRRNRHRRAGKRYEHKHGDGIRSIGAKSRSKSYSEYIEEGKKRSSSISTDGTKHQPGKSNDLSNEEAMRSRNLIDKVQNATVINKINARSVDRISSSEGLSDKGIKVEDSLCTSNSGLYPSSIPVKDANNNNKRHDRECHGKNLDVSEREKLGNDKKYKDHMHSSTGKNTEDIHNNNAKKQDEVDSQSFDVQSTKNKYASRFVGDNGIEKGSLETVFRGECGEFESAKNITRRAPSSVKDKGKLKEEFESLGEELFGSKGEFKMCIINYIDELSETGSKSDQELISKGVNTCERVDIKKFEDEDCLEGDSDLQSRKVLISNSHRDSEFISNDGIDHEFINVNCSGQRGILKNHHNEKSDMGIQVKSNNQRESSESKDGECEHKKYSERDDDSSRDKSLRKGSELKYDGEEEHSFNNRQGHQQHHSDNSKNIQEKFAETEGNNKFVCKQNSQDHQSIHVECDQSSRHIIFKGSSCVEPNDDEDSSEIYRSIFNCRGVWKKIKKVHTPLHGTIYSKEDEAIKRVSKRKPLKNPRSRLQIRMEEEKKRMEAEEEARQMELELRQFEEYEKAMILEDGMISDEFDFNNKGVLEELYDVTYAELFEVSPPNRKRKESPNQTIDSSSILSLTESPISYKDEIEYKNKNKAHNNKKDNLNKNKRDSSCKNRTNNKHNFKSDDSEYDEGESSDDLRAHNRRKRSDKESAISKYYKNNKGKYNKRKKSTKSRKLQENTRKDSCSDSSDVSNDREHTPKRSGKFKRKNHLREFGSDDSRTKPRRILTNSKLSNRAASDTEDYIVASQREVVRKAYGFINNRNNILDAPKKGKRPVRRSNSVESDMSCHRNVNISFNSRLNREKGGFRDYSDSLVDENSDVYVGLGENISRLDSFERHERDANEGYSEDDSNGAPSLLVSGKCSKDGNLRRSENTRNVRTPNQAKLVYLDSLKSVIATPIGIASPPDVKVTNCLIKNQHNTEKAKSIKKIVSSEDEEEENLEKFIERELVKSRSGPNMRTNNKDRIVKLANNLIERYDARFSIKAKEERKRNKEQVRNPNATIEELLAEDLCDQNRANTNDNNGVDTVKINILPKPDNIDLEENKPRNSGRIVDRKRRRRRRENKVSSHDTHKELEDHESSDNDQDNDDSIDPINDKKTETRYKDQSELYSKKDVVATSKDKSITERNNGNNYNNNISDKKKPSKSKDMMTVAKMDTRKASRKKDSSTSNSSEGSKGTSSSSQDSTPAPNEELTPRLSKEGKDKYKRSTQSPVGKSGKVVSLDGCLNSSNSMSLLTISQLENGDTTTDVRALEDKGDYSNGREHDDVEVNKVSDVKNSEKQVDNILQESQNKSDCVIKKEYPYVPESEYAMSTSETVLTPQSKATSASQPRNKNENGASASVRQSVCSDKTVSVDEYNQFSETSDKYYRHNDNASNNCESVNSRDVGYNKRCAKRYCKDNEFHPSEIKKAKEDNNMARIEKENSRSNAIKQTRNVCNNRPESCNLGDGIECKGVGSVSLCVNFSDSIAMGNRGLPTSDGVNSDCPRRSLPLDGNSTCKDLPESQQKVINTNNRAVEEKSRVTMETPVTKKDDILPANDLNVKKFATNKADGICENKCVKNSDGMRNAENIGMPNHEVIITESLAEKFNMVSTGIDTEPGNTDQDNSKVFLAKISTDNQLSFMDADESADKAMHISPIKVDVMCGRDSSISSRATSVRVISDCSEVEKLVTRDNNGLNLQNGEDTPHDMRTPPKSKVNDMQKRGETFTDDVEKFIVPLGMVEDSQVFYCTPPDNLSTASKKDASSKNDESQVTVKITDTQGSHNATNIARVNEQKHTSGYKCKIGNKGRNKKPSVVESSISSKFDHDSNEDNKVVSTQKNQEKRTRSGAHGNANKTNTNNFDSSISSKFEQDLNEKERVGHKPAIVSLNVCDASKEKMSARCSFNVKASDEQNVLLSSASSRFDNELNKEKHMILNDKNHDGKVRDVRDKVRVILKTPEQRADGVVPESLGTHTEDFNSKTSENQTGDLYPSRFDLRNLVERKVPKYRTQNPEPYRVNTVRVTLGVPMLRTLDASRAMRDSRRVLQHMELRDYRGIEEHPMYFNREFHRYDEEAFVNAYPRDMQNVRYSRDDRYRIDKSQPGMRDFRDIQGTERPSPPPYDDRYRIDKSQPGMRDFREIQDVDLRHPPPQACANQMDKDQITMRESVEMHVRTGENDPKSHMDRDRAEFRDVTGETLNNYQGCDTVDSSNINDMGTSHKYGDHSVHRDGKGVITEEFTHNAKLCSKVSDSVKPSENYEDGKSRPISNQHNQDLGAGVHLPTADRCENNTPGNDGTRNLARDSLHHINETCNKHDEVKTNSDKMGPIRSDGSENPKSGGDVDEPLIVTLDDYRRSKQPKNNRDKARSDPAATKGDGHVVTFNLDPGVQASSERNFVKPNQREKSIVGPTRAHDDDRALEKKSVKNSRFVKADRNVTLLNRTSRVGRSADGKLVKLSSNAINTNRRNELTKKIPRESKIREFYVPDREDVMNHPLKCVTARPTRNLHGRKARTEKALDIAKQVIESKYNINDNHFLADKYLKQMFKAVPKPNIPIKSKRERDPDRLDIRDVIDDLYEGKADFDFLQPDPNVINENVEHNVITELDMILERNENLIPERRVRISNKNIKDLGVAERKRRNNSLRSMNQGELFTKWKANAKKKLQNPQSRSDTAEAMHYKRNKLIPAGEMSLETLYELKTRRVESISNIEAQKELNRLMHYRRDQYAKELNAVRIIN